MKAYLPAKFSGSFLNFAQYTLMAIGVIALGYWAAVTIDARRFQNEGARRLAQERATQTALEKSAPPESVSVVAEKPKREGEAIATLAIPRIGLSSVVVEGDAEGDLKLGAGHVPGTPLPGESGNIGIAGHRDTVFRPLRLVRKDDVIVLTTWRGEDRYRVDSTSVVDPNDVAVLDPTAAPSLTLVTCYPFDYVGPAPKRFIVRAQQIQGAG